MLDHLILNTKKWFEISDSDTSIVANGKTWSPHPATVTVRQGGVIGALMEVLFQLVDLPLDVLARLTITMQ